MYEAIKDFNHSLDTLEFTVYKITPLKTAEDVQNLYYQLTAEIQEDLTSIFEDAHYTIFISALECIYGYNPDLAKSYISKLEVSLSDMMFRLAETFGPKNYAAIESLLKDHENESIFIKSVEENIAILIDGISEFCMTFMAKESYAMDYHSLILLAERQVALDDNESIDIIVTFIADTTATAPLPKLPKNELYFLADLLAYFYEKDIFNSTSKDIEHLLLRKRLPKYANKIHFKGTKVKSEAYRFGLLLGLTIKEMTHAFTFDSGVIAKTNKPKEYYITDFSQKLDLLAAIHFKNSSSEFFNLPSQ